VSEYETPVNDAAETDSVNSETTATAEAPSNANDDLTGGLEQELEQVKAQAQQYLEGWQRERAEFANYKRRIEQQQKDSYANATADVLKKVIPVIDDFDRAIANIPDDLASNAWVNGTMMIQRKLYKILDDSGVTTIDPQGEAFDPNRHEAVVMGDSDSVESGHVIEVMQKGYTQGDRLIRPALVKVAR